MNRPGFLRDAMTWISTGTIKHASVTRTEAKV